MGHKVLVTGGAGYVGSCLVPKLLGKGYEVVAYDLCVYGEDVLAGALYQPGFRLVKGDIRDVELLSTALVGVETVIHLACISNDPSFDLDPDLGKSINYDSFVPLVLACKSSGVRRFVFASSSSVYGVKSDPDVTEEATCEPLTDYSKYKALCEDLLRSQEEGGFGTVILRPATICGYAPRMRLDLVVNILTNHAINNRRIRVFGGRQKRPNIHIDDITDLYVDLVGRPEAEVVGKTWNVGSENHEVREIAATVKQVLGDPDVAIVTEPSDDDRSYHVSSRRIREAIGFTPTRSVSDAVVDVKEAFAAGRIPNPMDDDRYYNIRTMQNIGLR